MKGGCFLTAYDQLLLVMSVLPGQSVYFFSIFGLIISEKLHIILCLFILWFLVGELLLEYSALRACIEMLFLKRLLFHLDAHRLDHWMRCLPMLLPKFSVLISQHHVVVSKLGVFDPRLIEFLIELAVLQFESDVELRHLGWATFEFEPKYLFLSLFYFGSDVVDLNRGIFDDITVGNVRTRGLTWLIFSLPLSDGSHKYINNNFYCSSKTVSTSGSLLGKWGPGVINLIYIIDYWLRWGTSLFPITKLFPSNPSSKAAGTKNSTSSLPINKANPHLITILHLETLTVFRTIHSFSQDPIVLSKSIQTIKTRQFLWPMAWVMKSSIWNSPRTMRGAILLWNSFTTRLDLIDIPEMNRTSIRQPT